LGHKAFAARVRLETQGTSRTAHGAGGGGAGCAGNLRTDTGAPSAVLVLYCQILNVVKSTAHNAAGSMEGRIVAGYRDSRVTTCRLAPQIYVWRRGSTGRGEAAVQHGWKEVD
jgi:hypothetical protein